MTLISNFKIAFARESFIVGLLVSSLLGNAPDAAAGSPTGRFQDDTNTFSVEFPEGSRVKHVSQVVSMLGVRIPTRLYETSSAHLHLAVMAMDVDDESLPGNRALEEVARDVLDGAFSAGAVTILSRRGPFTRDGCAIAGASGRKSNVTVRYEVCACSRRSFQLMAISRRGVENESDAKRFFDTFRVIGGN